MRQTIVVPPAFERAWPFVADYLYRLWREGEQTELIRLEAEETRTLEQLVRAPETVHRLASFMAPTSPKALERFTSLCEASFYTSPYSSALPEACLAVLAKHEVRTLHHTNLGFWAQSVAEFALALTLCALRRIPHLHHEMTRSLEPWDYLSGAGRSVRAEQFSDDPRFSHGTPAGKRVWFVGAGNIASRYASFASFMGADVSAWDPFASDPCFYRAGAPRKAPRTPGSGRRHLRAHAPAHRRHARFSHRGPSAGAAKGLSGRPLHTGQDMRRARAEDSSARGRVEPRG